MWKQMKTKEKNKMEYSKRACGNSTEEPVDILDKLQNNCEKLNIISKSIRDRLSDILQCLTEICQKLDSKLELNYNYFPTGMDNKIHRYSVEVECNKGEYIPNPPMSPALIATRKLTISKRGPEVVSAKNPGNTNSDYLSDIINIADENSMTIQEIVSVFVSELSDREIACILMNIPVLLDTFNSIIATDVIEFNDSIERSWAGEL